MTDSSVHSPLPAQQNISKFNQWLFKLSKVPITEKLFFIQNLHVMIHAGLSLSRSLTTLALQTKNKYFRFVLEDISAEVEKGVTLTQALERHPRVFNELFCNMISSGEVSGNLEDVLKSLYLQLKKDHDLISKVRGAMIYPSVVLSAMILIGMVMMIFVMPKIISTFSEFGAELPLPTRILIWITNLMSTYSIAVGIIMVILVFGTAKFSRTHAGRLAFHWLWLRAPVVKNIAWKINIARFSRTLSSLLKTDISIIDAITITSKTVGNIYYQRAIASFSESVKTGAQIHTIMEQYSRLFPPLIVQMTLVGEESGTLDHILGEIAEFFEADVDQTMSNLPSLIEPILILVLGVGVGFIAVSVLMPMYNLTQSI